MSSPLLAPLGPFTVEELELLKHFPDLLQPFVDPLISLWKIYKEILHKLSRTQLKTLKRQWEREPEPKDPYAEIKQWMKKRNQEKYRLDPKEYKIIFEDPNLKEQDENESP